MKQKSLTVVLSVILLLLLGGLFIWQYQLFHAGNPDFQDRLHSVESYAIQGKWSQAQQEVESVLRIWKKGHTLIAIKYADTSFTLMNVTLDVLKAATEEKDLRTVRYSTKEALVLFDNITSLSPKSP
ncbi:hypothetical protein [Paenibacillus sp. CF384]|uniref:hypothetical protein n=1 Tax=Paenibacillus sp. CF384 TaxID=1884382 RepID=UPI000896D5B0|nr:hypothetical protein [Paenibacillus sp. CF384]SDX55694.1 protein of unknown function [Paenibacillus sp. CF384]